MRRLIQSITIVSLLVLAVPLTVNAASWRVSISTPEALTNDPTFNIEFTTLSTRSNDKITVKMTQSGPVSNTYQETTTAPYGGSDSFDVSLTQDGSYTFTFSASNNMGTSDTTDDETKPSGFESRTVTLDTQAPDAPNYDDFDRSGGTITLNFAAADADTETIAIYGSSSPTFTANSSTKLGEVDDSDTSFTYNANTDAERFHAVQAIDAAGNRSDLVGDENVTVIDETQTIQDEAGDAGATGATADEGAVLGEQDTEGEDTQDEPTQDTSSASTDGEDGQVAGAQDTADNEILPLWAWTLISLIGVALIALLISRFRNDFSEMFKRNRQ